MKTCPKCGNRIEDSSTTCPYCGQVLNNYVSPSKMNVNKEVASQTSLNNSSKTTPALTCRIISACFAFIGFIIFGFLEIPGLILGIIAIAYGNKCKGINCELLGN